MPPATAFVFSHPNHELAVFGLIQKRDPWMVYLTDGGGEDRVAQTREGLQRIGRIGKAVFLNHPEERFYRGLLNRDTAYFLDVAAEVRKALEGRNLDTVCADAIEFYNPVHDLAGPIARAALSGNTACRHYEVPLVHETPGPDHVCVVQRLPSTALQEAIEYRLSTPELDAKRTVRDEVYSLLAEQFGTALSDLSLEHLGLEMLGNPPNGGLREPGIGYNLRYERRAALLLQQGAIQEMITFQDHYLPVANGLLGK